MSASARREEPAWVPLPSRGPRLISGAMESLLASTAQHVALFIELAADIVRTAIAPGSA